jgi:molybdopterin biosynthesis enzyme
MLSGLAKANALMELPMATDVLAAGDEVEVVGLDWFG